MREGGLRPQEGVGDELREARERQRRNGVLAPGVLAREVDRGGAVEGSLDGAEGAREHVEEIEREARAGGEAEHHVEVHGSQPVEEVNEARRGGEEPRGDRDDQEVGHKTAEVFMARAIAVISRVCGRIGGAIVQARTTRDEAPRAWAHGPSGVSYR